MACAVVLTLFTHCSDLGLPVVFQMAECDVQDLEEVVDDLLACNIVAEDVFSLCMHDCLDLLQPLQLAIQYTWALYSKKEAMHESTSHCGAAASAFRSALQLYAQAAQAEVQIRSQNGHASTCESEQLRSQLRPLKKLYTAAKAELEVRPHTWLTWQACSSLQQCKHMTT